MSIYRMPDVLGEIVTTQLPSGDMAVRMPNSGPLEQLVFAICRHKGYRNSSYGGWIVPSSAIGGVRAALAARCTKVAD